MKDETDGFLMSEKIPDGWKRVKLGEILKLNYGKNLPETKRKNGQYPVYGSNGIIGYHNEFLVKGVGIIIGRKGSVGEVKLSKIDFYPIDTTYYVTTEKDNDICFLYYLLLTCNLKEMNSHSAVPGLNRNDVYAIEVLFPPLSEQQAIAGILSSLDDKIDLLHRQNKTLEEMAQTLFRKWFIEDIQEDWEEVSLGDIVEIKYGKNLSTSKLQAEGYPVFGGNGIIGHYTDYLYEEPQVLVACRGAGSGKVIISEPYSFITNNSFILERSKDDWVSFEFLKYWTLNYDFSPYISGSAQPQITIKDLFNASIILPKDKTIIRRFSVMIKPIEDKILKNKLQIRTLEQLKDALIPKLMSGEVGVRE